MTLNVDYKARVTEDTQLDSGGVLREGTTVKVWIETPDGYSGIRWVDRAGSHVMGIPTDRLVRVATACPAGGVFYDGPCPTHSTSADWRAEAARLVEVAKGLAAQAREITAEAAACERAAHELEWERVEWTALRSGDEVTMRVFGMNVGWERERRTIVSVSDNVVRLRDPDGREYDWSPLEDRHLHVRNIERRRDAQTTGG